MADAQIIKITSFSFLAVAQPFQKCSSSVTRPLSLVSIHESSSINITFFFSFDFLITSLSPSNASAHEVSLSLQSYPASDNDSLNLSNCSCFCVSALFFSSLPTPVCWMVNSYPKLSRIRYVFPILLLP